MSYTLQLFLSFLFFFTKYKSPNVGSHVLWPLYETIKHWNKRPKHRCVHFGLYTCPELHCILTHSKANKRKKGFRTQYFTPEALPEWIQVNMNCNSMLIIPSICRQSSHLFELFIYIQNINVHDSPVKEIVIFIPCIRQAILAQKARASTVCGSSKSFFFLSVLNQQIYEMPLLFFKSMDLVFIVSFKNVNHAHTRAIYQSARVARSVCSRGPSTSSASWRVLRVDASKQTAALFRYRWTPEGPAVTGLSCCACGSVWGCVWWWRWWWLIPL